MLRRRANAHARPRRGVPGARRLPRRGLAVLAAASVAAAAAACSTTHRAQTANARLTAVTCLPAAADSVIAGPADVVSAAVAGRLFASAPVVVLGDPDSTADLRTAAARALALHAPLLLTSPPGAPVHTASHGSGSASGAQARAGIFVSGAVRSEIEALGTRAVLAVGAADKLLAAQIPGVQVVARPAGLPKTSTPVPVIGVVLLVHRGADAPGALAAATTARAAGASVVEVTGYDPGADPAAIRALAAARPRHVIAVGGRFGPASRLAYRVAVAVTGVQLPGGGQVLFPMHRLVALYGYPGTPALGALGEQGLRASVARVRHLADLYRPLSSVPVVPAFEIIATVAQDSPGPDGTYSYESPISSLLPWVRTANADGLYVVLDLQPGRASLLTQAKHYARLLKLPDVGLALDPEWKLQPGQVPLRQIGGVSIAEVNSVVTWLARLTARYHLPQKLLVLHQFRLSMIVGEQGLDTHHQDLAIIIHMDGQGTPADKLQTWEAVTRAAPRGVFFGWKNFFVKDHPMLSPSQTMANRPHPLMISYE